PRGGSERGRHGQAGLVAPLCRSGNMRPNRRLEEFVSRYKGHEGMPVWLVEWERERFSRG
ncbi:MAG: hypothetical protein QGG40_20560, partial [Myxococcota bacterium]|nr:hypothetical protein [Myxococcota bacterium]